MRESHADHEAEVHPLGRVAQRPSGNCAEEEVREITDHYRKQRRWRRRRMTQRGEARALGRPRRENAEIQ